MKKIIFGVFFILFLTLFIFDRVTSQIILLTCFGWFFYLFYLIAHVQLDLKLISGVTLFLLVFTLSLHVFVQQICLKRSPFHWKMKWSGAMVLVLSCCLIVVFLINHSVEQIILLRQMNRAELTQLSGQIYFQEDSKNKLERFGDASGEYQKEMSSLPTYGSLQEGHLFPSSWETKLLPYLFESNQYQEIDFSIPWDHQDNKSVFQGSVYSFQTALSRLPDEDENHYGLSHYSSNALILARSRKYTSEEIQDGQTNTIIFGEVTKNLQPWGKPGNWRDPGIGLKKPEEGFRGQYKNGTHFTFIDGSVKHISNEIAPEVLKALSTPAGGEEITVDY